MNKKDYRIFLKGYSEEGLEDFRSDQSMGKAMPEMQKGYDADARLVDLPDPDASGIKTPPLFDVVIQRRSRRRYEDIPLTIEELSFLLYTTQGVKKTRRNKEGKPTTTIRTVPSAGARNAFETYLLINKVDGVDPGLYRYLPLDHKLVFLKSGRDLAERITDGCHGQGFVGSAPVVFIWTAVPYRMEWRYMHYGCKFIALDAGHVCQNLYLAAEAVGGGTCAIGAYLQEKMDDVLDVDGTDEFTIYIAPVGKVKQKKTAVLDDAALQNASGRYAMVRSPDKFFDVSVEGKNLNLSTPAGVVFLLVPESETSFFMDEIEDIKVSFEKDDAGKIVKMDIDQFGDIISAKKRD